MKLSTKVFALLATLFAALAMVTYGVQRQVILPSFVQLEQDAAHTDMSRVTETLKRELSLLQVLAGDWGNWADTYRYMSTHSPKFIDENMTEVALSAVNLNLVALINADGQYVWHGSYAPATSAPMPLKLLASPGLPVRHPWRAALKAAHQMSGMVSTEYGPMMLAMAPVLNGYGQGPARGAILMGRLLTAAEVARIAEQSQVSLQLILPDQLAVATRMALEEAKGSGSAHLLVAGSTNTEVFAPVSSLGGATAMVLKITVPRTISARGQDAVRYGLTTLFFAGLVILSVILLALRTMVLAPIGRITRQAVRIGTNDNLTERLAIRRADEVGILANEFDNMIEKLAQTRRQLIDASFESGIAEMASGALHNLGNALTPIGVHTVALQQRLRTAPTAEIGLALAELEKGATDPARQQDLQLFLRLAVQELATMAGAAAADTTRIADQVQAAQEILSAQVRFSRAGHVTETVTLDQLVDCAVELVPPDKLTRLDLQVDGTVRGLGALRLARVALQQVFQNLIVNAAEAAPPGARVTLRIAAAAEGPSATQRLHLVFADDGIGIKPPDLPHVFDKGFSTKPSQTNSGIGLHWSANVVTGLGGELRIESGGPSAGAQVHLILPLQRADETIMEMAA